MDPPPASGQAGPGAAGTDGSTFASLRHLISGLRHPDSIFHPPPSILALLLLLTAATGLAQPVITQQPQPCTNAIGSTAMFRVTATGQEPLAYQWQRYDSYYVAWLNQPGGTANPLCITNVQASNDGFYRVVVTNETGAVTSDAARLTVPQPATFQFSTTTFTVPEYAGVIALSVRRANDSTTTVSVDYTTMNGAAVAGADYVATNGTLTFAAGVTNQPLAIAIINDGLVEASEAFHVVLSNPSSGAMLGSPVVASMTISDNEPGRLQFRFVTNAVAEGSGTVLIGVTRGDDGLLPVAVNLATSDQTATGGLDYVATNCALAFAPTERTKWVPITLLNDGLKEANEDFRLTLSGVSGATLGSQVTTTVTIADDDQGFGFEFSAYTASEDAGAALVTVLRGSDLDLPFTVELATVNLSAISGLDYVGLTNTLAFAPGERAKVVPVTILNDGFREGTKTFRLTLSNPTGGSVLGSPTTTTVSLLDNDPGVTFEQLRFTNSWDSPGALTMTILRGNDGTVGPFTVAYAINDGSARAGVDYQAVSGMLQFQANETVKTISVPLLRGRAAEGTKYFRVTLSNPTGGAILGPTQFAYGDIVGTYMTVAPPFDPGLTLRHEWGVNVLNWHGGGQLQRADQVTGPWQTLTNTRGPFAIQSPLPTTFYRIKHPRAVRLYVPSTYDGQTPTPFVMLIHGYHSDPNWQESYMQIQPLAEARGFLYCHPVGNLDPSARYFWNGTDAATDFWNTGVDDAGYLRGVIQAVAGNFAVDRKRIHLIGHSNGGFMSYRLACESADLIAGIVSLAGATLLDTERCAPTEPVNIVQIHGTGDTIVTYVGNATVVSSTFPANMPARPGAVRSVEIWAAYNGASDPVTNTTPTLDLWGAGPGLDTYVTRYTSHPPGGAVELWTINGAGHVPSLSPSFSPTVIDWLLAHPKP